MGTHCGAVRSQSEGGNGNPLSFKRNIEYALATFHVLLVAMHGKELNTDAFPEACPQRLYNLPLSRTADCAIHNKCPAIR